MATFFSRIPKDVAPSFTPAQLDAVKLAFGARVRGAHAIDIRHSVPLGRRKAYFLLLAGLQRRASDGRSLNRLFRPLFSFGNALALGCFLLLLAISLLVIAYAGKRSAGLDIFPGIDMLNDFKMERMLR